MQSHASKKGGGIAKGNTIYFVHFLKPAFLIPPFLAWMENYSMPLGSMYFNYRENDHVPPWKNTHDVQTLRTAMPGPSAHTAAPRPPFFLSTF